MSALSLGTPVDVLLISDCQQETRNARQVLEQAKLKNRFRAISDGAEALTYLQRNRPIEDALNPLLVLLDVGFRGSSGFQFLGELQAEMDLTKNVVILMAGSEAERDIVSGLPHSAHYCIAKPITVEALHQVVRNVESLSLQVLHSY